MRPLCSISGTRPAGAPPGPNPGSVAYVRAPSVGTAVRQIDRSGLPVRSTAINRCLPWHKFASLCELLVSCKTPITEKLYHHEKACVDMMFAIYTILQRQILDRV